ncbi:hypothetical protein AAHE18_14G212500 [Arachis hypogaea]
MRNNYINMIFTALVTQLFLMSLCHLKYEIFLLFAGLICLSSLFCRKQSMLQLRKLISSLKTTSFGITL